jgi:hypothetical protein
MATRLSRLAVAFAAAAVTAATLAGCVGDPMPVPTESADSPSPSSSSTPRPGGAVLRPGESAAANQQFFDKVNSEFRAANGISTSRAIVDNLVAAGFVKADMEVTPDRTAINIAADSIVVSVRIDDECLVGQFGAAGYTGVLTPTLGSGKCLVGVTLPIDW